MEELRGGGVAAGRDGARGGEEADLQETSVQEQECRQCVEKQNQDMMGHDG